MDDVNGREPCARDLGTSVIECHMPLTLIESRRLPIS